MATRLPPAMDLYTVLSRLRFLPRYSYKFLFVGFVGIHLPLLGVLALLLVDDARIWPATTVVTLVAGLTFASVMLTLLALNHLLRPIRDVSRALVRYEAHRERPRLPDHYDDEAGLLMNDVQRTLNNLEDLLREKEDLVGLLSHDLRGPMNMSLRLIKVAEHERDDDALRAYLKALRTSMEKQYRLLSVVLLMLRAELDVAAQEEVTLKEIMEDVLDDVYLTAAEKSVRVQVDVPGDLRLRVQRELFAEALINLFNNALRFSHRRGVIHLRARADEKEVRIDLHDDGVGFDPALTEELFGRFTRLRREGTAGEKTSGLGLYLSRLIVQRQQGTLIARSDGPDRGSTFTILLPSLPTVATEPAV
ncbi:MAG: HAMP domain-containing sensor histidine kinase [Catalinimonas sp.]